MRFSDHVGYPGVVMVSHAEIPLGQALKQRVLVLNASPTNPAWSKLPGSAWGGTRFEGYFAQTLMQIADRCCETCFPINDQAVATVN
jgi:hypothetical protein